MTKAKGIAVTGGVMPDPSRATIKEIAEALGISKSQAERNALTDSWGFEEETVRGGKRRLYPLATLPLEVKAPLILRRMGLPGGARWLTAVEISGLGLFGVNASVIRAKAGIHAWPSRKRGRHGLEYPLADVVAPELITALRLLAGQIDIFRRARP